MKKVLLLSLVMVSPLVYGGGDGFPLRRSPDVTDLNEISMLKAEIEILKAELAEVKSVQEEVSVEKPQAVMDMVQTCVTLNGVTQELHCDVPNCHEVARSFWFSVDTGLILKRCDKHKDGVIIK